MEVSRKKKSKFNGKKSWSWVKGGTNAITILAFNYTATDFWRLCRISSVKKSDLLGARKGRPSKIREIKYQGGKPLCQMMVHY